MSTGNEICDICIDIMQWWSNNTGLSYGLINVLLFVVFQPGLILFFFSTTLAGCITKNRRFKKILIIGSIIMLLLLIMFTVVLLLLPFLDVSLQMRAEDALMN